MPTLEMYVKRTRETDQYQNSRIDGIGKEMDGGRWRLQAFSRHDGLSEALREIGKKRCGPTPDGEPHSCLELQATDQLEVHAEKDVVTQVPDSAPA